MRLGISVEVQDGLTWSKWQRIVPAVEALGFDSLWCSDHLQSRFRKHDSLECWLALTVAALETRRLRLGSLVSPITFRHPAVLGKLAIDLDLLSGGRLVLGVGAGWNHAEHRAFGLPFPPLVERIDRLKEAIEVIVRLQAGGPASFTGRYYGLDGADPTPKPLQHPRIPVLIGGGGERRTLPLVAHYADEWNLTTSSPELYRAKARRLAAYCREIGRDPGTIRHSVAAGCLLGRDAAELEQRSRAMQRLFPDLAALDVAAVPDAVRAFGWVAGSPVEVIAALRALAEEGVELAILQLPDHDDLALLELLARDVLPAVA